MTTQTKIPIDEVERNMKCRNFGTKLILETRYSWWLFPALYAHAFVSWVRGAEIDDKFVNKMVWRTLRLKFEGERRWRKAVDVCWIPGTEV
jgi:hypothetical protein